MADQAAMPLAESQLSDILFRVYVAGSVAFFAVAAFIQWRTDPGRITLLFVAIVETITVLLVICSRCAQRRDWRPLSVVATFIAMFYVLALDLDANVRLIPESAGASLQIVGLFVQVWAKLSLGRSFGVLPATRTLVTHGAYRWLRHPIYFGYLIAHLGFLLSNLSLQNVSVLILLYIAQVIRINREEEMLAALPGCSEYRKAVRYKLIPGVY